MYVCMYVCMYVGQAVAALHIADGHALPRHRLPRFLRSQLRRLVLWIHR
jgi:hypothetical protein